MARSNHGRKGHNLELTPEERQALSDHYAAKINAGLKEVTARQSDLNSAKAVVKSQFALVQKHLGITKTEFETEVLRVIDMTDKEWASAEKRRRELHGLAGKDPGEQLDLIERINDTVDDAIAAEADGYRAGRRADDPFPPDYIATYLHPDWQRGWIRGQEVNAKAEAMAAEVFARARAGEMAPDDDDDETSEGEGDEEFDPDAEARKLRGAGWTEPTSDESAFAET